MSAVTQGSAYTQESAYTEVLLDAGLVVPGTPTGAAPSANAERAVARTYTHGLLADRSIVRILPEPLVLAEDATLGALDLAPARPATSDPAPEAPRPVGFVRARAMGFPAWPILQDPDNAHHAIALVKDLEKAARKAKGNKLEAKEIVEDLASRLAGSAPHFLPTFYEEAARIFLAVGTTNYGTQYFGRARDAERDYGLAVDEDRHRQVFQEFAAAGALPTKAITAEVDRLLATFDPAEAFTRYLDLVVERAGNGARLHAGFPAEVKKLGKAAGMKPAAALEESMTRILPTGAMLSAGAKLWDQLGAAVRAVVAADPTVREHLAGEFPKDLLFDTWMDTVDELDLLGWLAEHGTPEQIAGWILAASRKRVGWVRGSGTTHGDPARMVAALERLPLHRLREAGVSVDLGMTTASGTLAALDVALEAGLEVNIGIAGGHTLPTRTVWEHLETGVERDLVHVAADPAWSEFVVACTARWGSDRHEDPYPDEIVARLLAQPSTLGLVRSALDRVLPVDGSRAINVRESRDLYNRFTPILHPDLLGPLDLEERTLAVLDPSPVFAEHLRVGLGSELAWPEWEDLSAQVPLGHEVDREAFEPDVVCWPYVGMVVGTEVVMLGPEGEALRHRFEPVPGHFGKGRDALVDATEAGGRWMVSLAAKRWHENLTYWVDDPANVVKDQAIFSTGSVPVGDVRVFQEGSVLRATDEPGPRVTWASLISDGERVWQQRARGFLPMELDPHTGEMIGESWPDWIQAVLDGLPEDAVLLPASARQVPGGIGVVTVVEPQDFHTDMVTHTSDGREIRRRLPVRFSGRITMGRRYKGPIEANRTDALIDAPGRTWLAVGEQLIDVDSGLSVDPLPSLSVGSYEGRKLPYEFWNGLEVRNPEVSARMRTITEDEAEPLLEVIVPGMLSYVQGEITDPDYLDAPPRAEEEDALDRILPGTTGALRTAVIGAARRTVHLAITWSLALRGLMPTAAQEEEWAREDAVEEDSSLDPVERQRRADATWEIDDGAADALMPLRRAGWRMRDRYAAEPALFAALSAWVHDQFDGRVAHDEMTVGYQQVRGGEWTVRDHLMYPGVALVAAATETDPARRATLLELTGRLGRGIFDGSTWLRHLKQDWWADREEMSYVLPTTDLPAEAASGAEPTRAVVMELTNHTPIAYGRGAPESIDHLAVADVVPTTGPVGPDLVTAHTVVEQHLEAAGPVPVRWSELDRVAEATGIDRIAVALLFATPSGRFSSEEDARAYAGHLGVKVTEAKNAVKSLVGYSTHALGEAIALSIPRPVNAWWNDDEASRAARTAALDRAAHRLLRDRPRFPVSAELRARADVELDASAGMVDRLVTPIEADRVTGADAVSHWDIGRAWRATAWLSATLPPDHEVRDELAGYTRWLARVVPASVTENYPRDVLGVPEDPVLDRFVEHLDPRRTTEEVRSFAGPGAAEFQNPRFSVPDLVPVVAADLGVDEDAAVYFLQLLALPTPKDADVKKWNGWKKAAFESARTALVEKDLVTEASRKGAGRTVFLPGGWTRIRGPKPLFTEEWKLPFVHVERGEGTSWLNAKVILPLVGYARLFEWAWERWTAGDRPTFTDLDDAMGSGR